MSRDIEDWVNSCEKRTTKKRPSQKNENSLQTLKPSYPFWHVAIAIMGPLLESEEFKFILVIGNQFSNWYEALPLQNKEAKTVAKALVDN